MTITWSQFIWGFGLLLGWTALLLGAIKYLLSRQVAAFETKIAEADAKAAKALSGLAEHRQAVTDSLANHKQSLSETASKLRVEIERRTVCGQHQRMEDNDKEIFQTLRQLHGDIGTLVGEIKGLRNSMDMVNQHLLNGGK